MFHGWRGYRVASLPVSADCGVCKEQPRKVQAVIPTGSKVIDTTSRQSFCGGRWSNHHNATREGFVNAKDISDTKRAWLYESAMGDKNQDY
jgi:hypothetical protein